MNTQLSNRTTMLNTVSAYLEEHKTVWNSMAPLQTALTDLEAEIAGIDADAQQHETPNGAVTDKADAREALEEVTFLMCEALSFVAHEAGDNDLVSLTALSRSSLGRMSGDELLHRATAVLARANAHQTELQPIQVTQANIAELSEALTEFDEAKVGPRTATASRAALTQAMPRRVSAAVDILRKRVDPLVSLFSRSNPDFVAGYETARAVVDRVATHKTKAVAAPAAPKP